MLNGKKKAAQAVKDAHKNADMLMKPYVDQTALKVPYSCSSPPLGGEVRSGGCTSLRSPLSPPLPQSGERRKKEKRTP